MIAPAALLCAASSVCLLLIVAVFGTLSSAVSHAMITRIFFADQDGYSSIVTPEFT
jgi:hypothetical protein